MQKIDAEADANAVSVGHSPPTQKEVRRRTLFHVHDFIDNERERCVADGILPQNLTMKYRLTREGCGDGR